MTREDLQQLNILRKEIAEIESVIRNLRSQTAGTVTEKVKASGKDYPYINGFKQITGFNMAADNRRKRMIKDKEALLEKKTALLERMERKIIKYIGSVEDERVRTVMQLRYVDGYKWEKIGEILNFDRTYPRKLVDVYFRKTHGKAAEKDSH